MTKREIMKKAHEIARQMEGHYHARLALGLRLAWKEKKEKKEEKKELTVGTILPGWGEKWDGFWEELEECGSPHLKKNITFERFRRVTLGEAEFTTLKSPEWYKIQKDLVTRTEIIRETEKAIQVRVEWKSNNPHWDETEEGTSTDWLPKSQIERDGDIILIPQWLAKKKNIVGQPISIVKEVEDR